MSIDKEILMSTDKEILMSTHNIYFYGNLKKIILKLSPNTLLTCSPVRFCFQIVKKKFGWLCFWISFFSMDRLCLEPKSMKPIPHVPNTYFTRMASQSGLINPWQFSSLRMAVLASTVSIRWLMRLLQVMSWSIMSQMSKYLWYTIFWHNSTVIWNLALS